MLDYVMFGHCCRLGDYIDILHLSGGQIKKIIVNMPDAADRAGRSLVSRLEQYNTWRHEIGLETDTLVEQLSDFSPSEGERYLLGFSGLGQLPMQAYLSKQWGLQLETLVHPTAWVSPTAEIGRGCVVSAGCVVASEVRVGPFCWLGRGSTIGHDSEIEEGAFLGPGANLASAVRIGRGANIGIGANVLEYTAVGEQCVVAGGALVRQDTQPFSMVAGVPAVFKKELEPKVFPDQPAGVS